MRRLPRPWACCCAKSWPASPVPPSGHALVDLWRKEIEDKGGKSLDKLLTRYENQEEFSKAAKTLLRDLNLVPESELDDPDASDEEEGDDQEPDQGDSSDKSPEQGEGENDSQDSEQDEQAGESRRNRRCRRHRIGHGRYRRGRGRRSRRRRAHAAARQGRRHAALQPVPTTRSSPPSSTRSSRRPNSARPTSSTSCARLLDKQLENLAGAVARLANKLQRRLMAKQNRSWQFDLEEGLLDTARLTRVVTDPMQALSFKVENDTDFRDTIVTLLIDNSGSMRGRPITIAAICGDILARTLERCGVKVEILGFTTRAWKGGKSPRGLARSRSPGQSGPRQRRAPHHLQGRRRAVAPCAAQSRPDDARGPAQGKHRRRGARMGAQAADGPPGSPPHPDGDFRRRAGR